MTNRELLSRRMALQQAAQLFSTTKAKYAIQKNLKRVERELEAYNETLQDLAEEDVGAETLNAAIQAAYSGEHAPEDAPDKLLHDLEDLLAEDGGDPAVHSIPEETLDKEDDAGSEIPFRIVSALDFMIEEE